MSPSLFCAGVDAVETDANGIDAWILLPNFSSTSWGAGSGMSIRPARVGTLPETSDVWSDGPDILQAETKTVKKM